MTILLSVVLILLVAAFVVLPLLRPAADAVGEIAGAGNELWRREKAVAVLAISEADFDRATGKLTDDDYHVLRSDYEGRALQAMDEIEKLTPAAAAAAGGYCAHCGAAFGARDAFCGACGHQRTAA